MKVSHKNLAKVMTIDESSAKIIAEDEKFHYRVTLHVNLARALRSSSNIVELEIFAEDPNNFRVTQDPQDPIKAVRAVLYSAADQKSAAIVRSGKIITTSKVDLTSKVDNSMITSIKNGSETSAKILEVSSVTKEISTASQASQAQRIYASANVLQAGIDPADANKLTTLAIPAKHVLHGMTTLARISENSEIKRLTFVPKSSQGKITGRQKLTRSTGRSISGFFDIPVEMMSEHRYFYIVGKLISNVGMVVASTVAKIDHVAALQAFYTPASAPVVRISSTGQGHVNFEISQIDQKTDKIAIYRRDVKHVTIDALDSNYMKVIELDHFQAGHTKYSDRNTSRNITIYRFVPIGKLGATASDFSSVVYRPPNEHIKTGPRRPIFWALTIVPQNVDSGIGLRISSFPPSARSIGIVRRDLTLFETKFSFLGVADPVVRIDDPHSEIVVTDTITKFDHIYEYGCVIYTKDGSEHQPVTTTVIKRVVRNNTGIKLTIDDVNVDDTGFVPDVKFSLRSATQDSVLSTTIANLQSLGLSDVYSAEIEASKSSLSDMITHNVQRIDMSTGEVADFGTITESTFSDVSSRTNSVVQDMVPGRKYRYVVTTQFRSTDTLLDSRIVEKTSEFGIKYSYSPKKFMNPITLRTGTLLPNDGSSVHHPEDEFRLGSLGNETYIEVSVQETGKTQLQASSAIKSGRRVLSLSAISRPEEHDYFEIFEITPDSTRTIGRVQSTGMTSYDFVIPDDVSGQMVVMPIMKNFTQGSYVLIDSEQ